MIKPHSPRLRRPLSLALVGTLLGSALSGCGFPRPFIGGDPARPSTDVGPSLTAEQPQLYVETAPWDNNVLQIRPMQSSGALPHQRVERLSVTEAGLYDVIQLLFDKSPLSVTFEGGTDNIRRYGPVTVYNLSGTLTEVMNRLGESLGFFWSVNGNFINIEAEQQFIVDLPPVLNDDNLAGISNTLQYLGVRDTYLDRNERRLVFRSNRKALRAAESYLSRLRETRSMIIYDAQILQVDLRDTLSMGIQWGNYAKRDPKAAVYSKVPPSSGSAGFDITLVGNSFSANLLLDFLRTQGTVKNLSQPRIGVMSGTRGSLRVGNTTTIVSRVGRDINNTVSQTTVETRDVQTGLELSLFGEEHDRTVYTRIGLSITELLELTTFEALGTKLSLPKIADRELKTQIRSRPGDTIILGGITINRGDRQDSQGLTINRQSLESNVSELVVVLRPRLVMFRPPITGNPSITESPPVVTTASAPGSTAGISSPEATTSEVAIREDISESLPAASVIQPVTADRPPAPTEIQLPGFRFTTPARKATQTGGL